MGRRYGLENSYYGWAERRWKDREPDGADLSLKEKCEIIERRLEEEDERERAYEKSLKRSYENPAHKIHPVKETKKLSIRPKKSGTMEQLLWLISKLWDLVTIVFCGLLALGLGWFILNAIGSFF